MTRDLDTIFALSSGRPPAAIAIVRISGPAAASTLRHFGITSLHPRRATRARLNTPDGRRIDDAIVILYPAPSSATGEDVAEFHVHGGRAVLAALFSEFDRLGLRPAEPGEFTRRAFENGKIDLTEAEGIDDLIHADTERQRRQALRLVEGQLGSRAEVWRGRILDALAMAAAAIDFSDEGDIPNGVLAEAQRQARELRTEIVAVLAEAKASERLRDGLVIAIAGPPNVGKSTLLNRLARREAAIVSPIAGTTRDVIEVHLDLDGYPLTLLDTAGIRDSDDPVEAEGVSRARARAAAADLVLWLEAGSDGAVPTGVPGSVWTIGAKADLRDPAPDARHMISATTGQGVDDLVRDLSDFAADQLGRGEAGLITRIRHRQLLSDAVESLDMALAAAGTGEELVAEHLRHASNSLGRLVGRIDVEDVLGAIFSRFCIGK